MRHALVALAVLACLPVFAGDVGLAWNYPSDETQDGFRVRYITNPTAPVVSLEADAECEPHPTAAGMIRCTSVCLDLQNAPRLFFAVVAYNEAGEGPASGTVSKDYHPPTAAPTALEVLP